MCIQTLTITQQINISINVKCIFLGQEYLKY